jgi:hypothetical protein
MVSTLDLARVLDAAPLDATPVLLPISERTNDVRIFSDTNSVGTARVQSRFAESRTNPRSRLKISSFIQNSSFFDSLSVKAGPASGARIGAGGHSGETSVPRFLRQRNIGNFSLKSAVAPVVMEAPGTYSPGEGTTSYSLNQSSKAKTRFD